MGKGPGGVHHGVHLSVLVSLAMHDGRPLRLRLLSSATNSKQAPPKSAGDVRQYMQRVLQLLP